MSYYDGSSYGQGGGYNLGGYGGYPCVIPPQPCIPQPIATPPPQQQASVIHCQPIHTYHHYQPPPPPPMPIPQPIPQPLPQIHHHHQQPQQQHHHHRPHHVQHHHQQPQRHHQQRVEQVECVEVNSRGHHQYEDRSGYHSETLTATPTPPPIQIPTPVIPTGPSSSYDSYQQRSQSQNQSINQVISNSIHQSSSQNQQQQQSQQSYSILNGGASTTTAASTGLSQIEQAILRSNAPIDIHETEEITVNGQRGIWANKQEVVNWRGPIPVSQYAINEDSNPEIITKRTGHQVEYIQELAIRYLRPPTPPAPGEIIITQEVNSLTPPAPPLIIRQQPPRPTTPEPLVIREAPPQPPCQVGRKVITISGKRLPPPPRKVIIERLAPLPSKPQSVIVERWLPYSQPKRRVIFQRSNERDPVIVKPRNVVIQWEAPRVNIKKEIKYLGVIRANPVEYVQRYGTSLKTSRELPDFVLDIKTPEGIVLAADYKYNNVHELEGEVAALKLVDLDREGLSEYRSYLQRLGISYVGAQNINQAVSQFNSSQVNVSSSQHQQQQIFSTESTAVNTSIINASSATTNYNLGRASGLTTTNSASVGYDLAASGNSAAANNFAYCGSGSYENSYGYGAPPKNTNQQDLSTSTSESEASPQEVLAEIFVSVDRERNGRISYEEAERLLLRLNSKLNRSYGEHDVRAFFQQLEVTRDGTIDAQEFRAAFERLI